MGIRGTLAVGLAGLLLTAGLIAGIVINQVVGGEAEAQVVAQFEKRAQGLAGQVGAVCRDMTVCLPQISRLLQPNQAALAGVTLLDGQLQPIAGTIETTTREAYLGDVLHGAPWASARVHRAENHPRGSGVDHRVAVRVRLGDGRTAVLDVRFSLDGLHRAVDARQWAVLLFIVADLLVILLFGVYLSGRSIVLPLQALTQAAEAARAPKKLLSGPVEIQRLSEAFSNLFEQLHTRNLALQNSVDALQATQNELVRSEKLATVGRLAAGLAHEIGNPLAAVMGYVEFLQGGAEADLRTQLLARMDKELSRIRGTLRDLLDFSRPAAGVPSQLGLQAVVESAVSLVRYQQVFRAVEVQVSGSCPSVWADRDRVRQVLVNLLLNAADAVQGEGSIQVVLAAVEGDAQVSVIDDGPGVPADEAALLFEPFYTTKPVGQGTGLGLAICQQLIEQAGGRLWLAESETGATFVMRLPHQQQRELLGESPEKVMTKEQGLESGQGEEGPERDGHA